MWTLYGERFSDSDFSGAPRVYQSFSILRSLKLKALRTAFVYFNNPTFTELQMRIYNDNGSGAPSDLLATFDKKWTPLQITSYDYAGLEIYFDFTNPIKLARNTTYHLVPWLTGSALSSASHLAWMKGYPDANTTNAESVELANLGSSPFYMALIGAKY